MKPLLRSLVVLALLLLWSGHAAATPRLHPLFSEGCVLQRDMPVAIFGTTDVPSESVTVSLAGRQASTRADHGRWRLSLPPLQAGGPYLLVVNATLSVNVYVGEVWLCGGQSNMEWPLVDTVGAAPAIANEFDPLLRLLVVPHGTADEPREQLDATPPWTPSESASAARFSAIGWYFGRRLRSKLDVPVGLIESAWGGTAAEAWVSPQTLRASFPGFADAYRRDLERYPAEMQAWRDATAAWEREHKVAYDAWTAQAEAARRDGRSVPPGPAGPPPTPWDPRLLPNYGSHLYNAMIAPLQGYTIRGVIWYQGESNAHRPAEYARLFPALIRDWRAAWGQGDFPFLFVQLAPWKAVDQPPGTDYAALREAQRRTAQQVPRTAMVVTVDHGDENDIHPRVKAPVADRLFLAARALAYGERVVYQGPAFASMKPVGKGLLLTFDHAAGGLVTSDRQPPRGFTVAGADGVYRVAKATIDGTRIAVSSPAVPRPLAVRYGWSDAPRLNLFNRQGLPASPFQTKPF